MSCRFPWEPEELGIPCLSLYEDEEGGAALARDGGVDFPMSGLAAGLGGPGAFEDRHTSGNVIFPVSASDIASFHSFSMPSGKKPNEMTGVDVEPAVDSFVADMAAGQIEPNPARNDLG
jgi:hypothetical protein